MIRPRSGVFLNRLSRVLAETGLKAAKERARGGGLVREKPQRKEPDSFAQRGPYQLSPVTKSDGHDSKPAVYFGTTAFKVKTRGKQCTEES